ncbi:hypothetical protein K501DRAFT_329326 [Backusella circina FSU 941]|nr:hypothetical protein K501DRAFT_329326 [Backusella circina FSU 941]
MGTGLSKDFYSRHQELVDFGPVYSQVLDKDYDVKIVKRLVKEGRLAPFYHGITDEDSRSLLDMISHSIHIQRLYSETVECPICLLCYPKNINYSRCCDKPICTDCFLQMKRSEESPQTPAVCPYCVHSHFGVIHIPPKWSINYPRFSKRRADIADTLDIRDISRRKPLSKDDPDVVFVDQVRPDWFETIVLQKGISGSAGNGTTRRTVVRLNRNSSSDSEEESGSQPYQWDLEEILVLETIRHIHQTTSNNNNNNNNSNNKDQSIPSMN